MQIYMQWKQSYSVGDASIDEQHKQIIEIINNLHYLMEIGGNREKFKEQLTQLSQYTVTHFEHEERAMQKCGYPDLANHKALHDDMRRRTLGLCDNLKLLTERDLLVFLKDWWLNHIRSEDRCYVPYLLGNVPARQPSVTMPTQPVSPISWGG
jgi:hemerythrin-like metal-binding protein